MEFPGYDAGLSVGIGRVEIGTGCESYYRREYEW